MIEKIQVMSEQCTEWVTGTIDGDYEKFDKQKFAKLIVQDILDSLECERESYANPGTYEPEEWYIKMFAKEQAIEDAISMIKSNFEITN